MGQIELNIVFLFPRCMEIEWRAVDTASSWGSVGSECRPLRVQAGWDVHFDVLERQFLKALHKNRSECHRGATHSPGFISVFSDV